MTSTVDALSLSEANRCFVVLKSSLFQDSKMAEREHNVFMAKLAEQAERYEGKRRGFDATVGLFEAVESSSWSHAESVTVGK